MRTQQTDKLSAHRRRLIIPHGIDALELITSAGRGTFRKAASHNSCVLTHFLPQQLASARSPSLFLPFFSTIEPCDLAFNPEKKPKHFLEQE